MKRVLGLAVAAALVVPVFATMAHADPPTNSIVGTNHRDTLVGTRSRDVIFGLGRPDRIYPGGSFDKVFAGSGSDRIYAVDGHTDIVSGGFPSAAFAERHGLRGDRCIVDDRDILFGCERVIVRSAH